VYETFTEAARGAIALAADEARALGHDHVGTEHLLLGLIAERAGSAGRAFERLGVTLEAARDRVSAEVHRRPQAHADDPLPLTPRARGTLDAAPRQALGLKDDAVGTEHVLLALLIERDTRTASVLAALGLPPDLLRETLFEQRRAGAEEDDGDALLALADQRGVAARALAELGVTADALRAAVERARAS